MLSDFTATYFQRSESPQLEAQIRKKTFRKNNNLFDNTIFKIDAYLVEKSEDPVATLADDEEKLNFIFGAVKIKPVNVKKAFFCPNDKPVKQLFAYDPDLQRYTLLLRFSKSLNRRGRLNTCLLISKHTLNVGLKICILADCFKGKKWEDYLQGPQNAYLKRKWEEHEAKPLTLNSPSRRDQRTQTSPYHYASPSPRKNIKIDNIFMHEEKPEIVFRNNLDYLLDLARERKSPYFLEFRKYIYTQVLSPHFDRLVGAVVQESTIINLEFIRNKAKLYDLNAHYSSIDKEEDRTHHYVLDCEMAEFYFKTNKAISMTIFNLDGYLLFDKEMNPGGRIHNAGTPIHFIDERQIKQAVNCSRIRNSVEWILNDRKGVIIGYALENDLQALKMAGFFINPTIPKIDIQKFSQFCRPNKSPVRLEQLVAEIWGCKMPFVHKAGADARATLYLYKLFRREIHAELGGKFDTLS